VAVDRPDLHGRDLVAEALKHLSGGRIKALPAHPLDEGFRRARLSRAIAREQTLSGSHTQQASTLRFQQRPKRLRDPLSGREIIDWSQVGEGDFA
jgi:hypothetical protein